MQNDKQQNCSYAVSIGAACTVCCANKVWGCAAVSPQAGISHHSWHKHLAQAPRYFTDGDKSSKSLPARSLAPLAVLTVYTGRRCLSLVSASGGPQ